VLVLVAIFAAAAAHKEGLDVAWWLYMVVLLFEGNETGGD
jgi:hypothetical protein